MTNGERSIKELKEKWKQLEAIREEISDLESNLCGAEINHPRYFYSMIEHIDGDDVLLYCEDEEEEQYEESISLDELEDILKN